MTNNNITLNDIIAYATINYIAPITTIDDIELLDTIAPEMRDTHDELIRCFCIDDDEYDAAALDALIDDTRAYDRLLDITLARLDPNIDHAKIAYA